MMTYVQYFLLISILCSAIGGGYVASKLYNNGIKAQKTTVERLSQELEKGLVTLNQRLSAIYTIDQGLIRIAVSKPSLETIESGLTEIMKKNKVLTSCGIVYAPYMYNSTEKFASRRIVRTEKDFVVYPMESREDYTNAEWYRVTKTGKTYWTDPFLDEYSKELIIRCSYPFFMENPTTHKHEFAGVANTSISILELNNVVMDISVEKKTYALLVHDNGTILAYPSEELLYQEQTLFNLSRHPGKQYLLTLYNELKKNKEGEIELRLNGGQQDKNFYAVFARVPLTNWSLIVIRLETHKLIDSIQMRRTITHLLIILLIFLISLFSFFYLYVSKHIRSAWLIPSWSAFLFLVGIVLIWTLDITSNISSNLYANIVDTELALDRFFFLQRKAYPLVYKQNPHFIPTGLYITSLDVGTDSFVRITGYVWQKYDRTKHTTDQPGFIILNATEQSAEQVYVATKNDIETIGWRFKATIKSNFNYLKYPFDEQELIIAFSHKNYLTNTVLTPDFDAFELSDSLHPEINPDINTGAWIIKRTASFYQLTDFTTNFGIQGYKRQKGFPNLAYAIAIRRKFVYPLTASALPVSIILVVVFSIVLFTGLTKNRIALPTEIIKLTASIFFGAAVSHQTFQRALYSPVITYFEYFYFLIYIIILLTTINGMLYGYERGGSIISAYNNLIPRIMYWPVTLFLGLALTLFFFY